MRRSAFGSETATAQLFALPPRSLSNSLTCCASSSALLIASGTARERVIGQHEAVIALALQQHTFENVLAEIDADD